MGCLQNIFTNAQVFDDNISTIAKKIKAAVCKATHQEQDPWIHDTLTDDPVMFCTEKEFFRDHKDIEYTGNNRKRLPSPERTQMQQHSSTTPRGQHDTEVEKRIRKANSYDEFKEWLGYEKMA